ncbi:ATP-binding protein [Aquaspirillum soli]
MRDSHRKKLPIGIQTFSEIRQNHYYYIDKSEMAYRLANEGKHYFLSRPRRFGKSLFLDTLAELWAGNEALFQGLWIHDKWDWSVSYPVIRISFGGGVMMNVETQLPNKIAEQMRINAERLGLNIELGEAETCFANLIRAAEAKTGQKVVILIDEYDKPILDNLTDPELAKAMRNRLRNLYSVIKDLDASIRFVFLTGVSKFSKVSLFSGLNNLNDITLDAEYSAICGYTDHDIDTVFAPELAGLDREQIREWYNGYNWLGESVYNPFDVLLLFQKRQFRAYWFETGTPTFLIDILRQRQAFTPELSQLVTMETLLSRFDVEDIPTEALMFQTGYLTIADSFHMGALTEYTLKYPNLEVQASLNGVLLEMLMGNSSLPHQYTGQLYRLLSKADVSKLETLLHALFASIPYDWQRNNAIAQYEGYYASVFYSYFAALGLDIRLEDITNKGRIDMAVLFNQQVYLFEFKVVEATPQGKALQQLQDREYAEKYRSRGEPIHLIGIEFSREQRNVVGFEWVTL